MTSPGFIMEEAEKRVLRRRKFYLAETVMVTDVFADMLHMAGVLSTAQVKTVSVSPILRLF